MKKKILLLALVSAGSAGLAFAQDSSSDSNGKPGGPPPHHPPPPFGKILEAVDTDHDGIISPEEIAAAPDTLKTLDKNSDGQLSKDEFLPPPPQPPGAQGGGQQRGNQRGVSNNYNRPEKKKRITTKSDSDSSISNASEGGQSESGERKGPPPPPIIAVLDADHDQTISAGEIAGSAEALKSLDKNDDSQLGPGEYAHPPRPPEDGEKPIGQQGGENSSSSGSGGQGTNDQFSTKGSE